MTLTDLKRIFVPGFECLCKHNVKGPCSSQRRVEKVQTNAIAMIGPDFGAKLGWLPRPQAGDVLITELPNGVEIRFKKQPILLRYEWITLET